MLKTKKIVHIKFAYRFVIRFSNQEIGMYISQKVYLNMLNDFLDKGIREDIFFKFFILFFNQSESIIL